jgi:putative transposase
MTQFERCAVTELFAIVAYCFMPDHVHFLVEGQADASDLRRFVARAKQFSGFYYHYIVENPLRAGLVRRIEDYPFSGSAVYTVKEII